MDRRTLLRTSLPAAALGLSGCQFTGSGGAPTDRSTATETATEGATATERPEAQTFYVSPEGDDDWSGRQADPGSGDGPFRTIERAKRAIRRLSAAERSDPIRVVLRGGRYRIADPIVFQPQDSGRASAPIRYEAAAGETPVVSGGREITDWEETTVAGQRAWETRLRDVRQGEETFKQLWVDGERRHRPRLPEQVDSQFAPRSEAAQADVEYFRTERGPEDPKTFVAPDVGRLDAVQNVELVRMDGWTSERVPIESFDSSTDQVTVGRRTAPDREETPSDFPWHVGDGYYYLENVRSALEKPGQWYLDEDDGTLTYLPREGESLDETTVVAPHTDLSTLVRFAGERGDRVEDLVFDGLTFEHAGWEYPPTGPTGVAATVPGTIELHRSSDLTFTNCTVRHVGQAGVGLGRRCENVTIERCSFRDTGAGGVTCRPGKRWEGPPADTVTVVDNHVRDVGQVFHAAMGILLKRVQNGTVAHNHVEDCYQGGIQVGIRPGYGEVETADNTIEQNHVHDVGGLRPQEKIGIYVTSEQPNLRIRNNVVHRCWKHTPQHGGGIDLDPAVRGAVIENNVIYDSDHPFDFFFGADNLVRNNVFVGGLDNVADAGPVADRRNETVVTPEGGADTSLTFRHNVLVAEGTPIYDDIRDDVGEVVRSDENCLWDRERDEVIIANDWDTDPMALDRWRESTGNDRNSIVADPKIETLSGTEIALAEDSPAFDVGFEAIDTSDVGPR